MVITVVSIIREVGLERQIGRVELFAVSVSCDYVVYGIFRRMKRSRWS